MPSLLYCHCLLQRLWVSEMEMDEADGFVLSERSFPRPDYGSKAVQDSLQRLASIDLLNLCNEAKVEYCRATRDLWSCGSPVECVLISCGHASLCAECSQRCDICPICRTPLVKNSNAVQPGLYYQCVEAGLIPRVCDGRSQDNEEEETQLTADVRRLYSFFDVALENNLCCLICQYVTDVCMDDKAVSSDPVIAFLLDEVVVKDWCKKTFRRIIVELRQLYNLEADKVKEGMESLMGFAGKLSSLSNVLEVLELSFKDAQSANLDDLQYLLESILKTKQHLEMMTWCIRHRFLDHIRSQHADLQSWCNLFHDRKAAAIQRAWPEPANYSTNSTGKGTLFIEDALLNLEIEKGPEHRDLENDLISLQKDGGSSLIRSKIAGLVGIYPFESLRAVVDILFLYGSCDMVVAKQAIFLYYLYDRLWTVPEDQWKSTLDDFAAVFGITRHSLLESFCFYLLDDHSDAALKEVCDLLPEIAVPESHPKIAEVLLERDTPDTALMFLQLTGKDGSADLVSLGDAITAIRVWVESGLLTEAFMHQRRMWMKTKERELKHPQTATGPDHIKDNNGSWIKWVEHLVTEICLLCIRRNFVELIIEFPWNYDEEKHLHECLFNHAISDPSTTIGSLLVVYYLQRHRYTDAYHVEHKLRMAEQEYLSKNNIEDEVLSRIKSTGHWRASLVSNCIVLLPEVQQQQLRAGKLDGNVAWTAHDGGSSRGAIAEVDGEQAVLPSTSASSLLLKIDHMDSSPQVAEAGSVKPKNVHESGFSSAAWPRFFSTTERGLKRHYDLINGKFGVVSSFPGLHGHNLASPLADKEIYRYSSRALPMAHQDGQLGGYTPEGEQSSLFKQMPQMSPYSSRRIMAKPEQTPLISRGLRNNDSPHERHVSVLNKMHSLDTQDITNGTLDSSTDVMVWSQENGSVADELNQNGEARWRSGDTSDEEDHSPDLPTRTASRTPGRGSRRSRLSRR